MTGRKKDLKELTEKRKHVFEVIKAKEKKEVEKVSQKYIKFLSEAKTERECVEWAISLLKEKGFKEGEDFYVYKNKYLAFWKKGKKSLLNGLKIIASHIDSPRLDLKLHPLFEDTSLVFLKTHYYGGIKKFHWVAIPLALHGIVVKKDGRKVKIVWGEKEGESVFTVCDLLPHLARKVQGEKKIFQAIPGEKLNILVGGIPLTDEKKEKEQFKLYILKILNEKFGIKEEDFVSAEICAVPAGSAREVGFDSAFIGGYGQDDRICAFSSFEAFLKVENPEYSILVIFMDKEEIGSDGNTGAKSRVLEGIIYSLLEKWENKKDPLSFFQVMEKTQAISADVTAGIDPNYVEVHDKLNDAKMGYGVAVSRYTGHGGKYMANEAHSEFLASLLGLWDKHGVVYQVCSMGRVDEGGGGTVAKYLASFGMDVVDAGPPLLSMHSPFEISHKADLYMTVKAFETFLKF